MKSYLIKDTTREERQKYVDDALTISQIDAGAPSKGTIELLDLYIAGKMEIEDVQKEIIRRAKEGIID